MVTQGGNLARRFSKNITERLQMFVSMVTTTFCLIPDTVAGVLATEISPSANANPGVGRIAVVLLVGNDPDPDASFIVVVHIGVETLLVAVGLERWACNESLPVEAASGCGTVSVVCDYREQRVCFVVKRHPVGSPAIAHANTELVEGEVTVRREFCFLVVDTPCSASTIEGRVVSPESRIVPKGSLNMELLLWGNTSSHCIVANKLKYKTLSL